LEIVRIGKPDAPFRVFLRARAHGFETGGNWVVQGLIHSLLQKGSSVYLQKYCVYILPMANKDAVALGRTRFNGQGMDLNRNWDKLASPEYTPENYALEIWLRDIISKGKKPDLAIDLHNDRGGNLHVSHPNTNLEKYLSHAQRFESLLYKYTWFTEGKTGAEFRNPGTIGEGLAERYGIDAFIFELNFEWSAGLKKVPAGKDWELLGKQLRDVFLEYFNGKK
jgi:predicted deacylase